MIFACNWRIMKLFPHLSSPLHILSLCEITRFDSSILFAPIFAIKSPCFLEPIGMHWMITSYVYSLGIPRKKRANRYTFSQNSRGVDGWVKFYLWANLHTGGGARGNRTRKFQRIIWPPHFKILLIQSWLLYITLQMTASPSPLPQCPSPPPNSQISSTYPSWMAGQKITLWARPNSLEHITAKSFVTYLLGNKTM